MHIVRKNILNLIIIYIINILKETVGKVGLQISFEETEYMTTNKLAPKSLEFPVQIFW